MQLRNFVISMFLLSGSVDFCSGQGLGGIPFFKPGGLGLGKSFAVPTLKDFDQFGKGYAKHLKMLDQRSEKAYRRSFLKFVETENLLLESLCETNEFRANALMRSSAASFGAIERQFIKAQGKNTSNYNHQSEKLKVLGAHTAKIINVEGDASDRVSKMQNNSAKSAKCGSKFYAEYMQKRLRLYRESFADCTKEQKRWMRELEKRSLLWGAYKDADQKIINDFAEKHEALAQGLMKNSDYTRAIASLQPNYSGTQLDPASVLHADNPLSNFSAEGLLAQVKARLSADGIMDANASEKLGSLFKAMDKGEKLIAASDSILSMAENITNKKEQKDKEKEIKSPDANAGKRFVDRLYGGVDFSFEPSSRYYPQGMSVALTGGYKLSENSGIAFETNSVLSGEKMGFNEDNRFESTLISNYSLGANIDYRIWKFIFIGAGAEYIINQLEAPIENLLFELGTSRSNIGVPLILRLLPSGSGNGSTSIEIRYDLNARNNIRPEFDFRVGILIGRK